MAQNSQLRLEIVTQERKLVDIDIDKVSVPGVEGEITILPKHIALFTKIKEGIVKYWIGDKEQYIAVFGGFMDVSPLGKITILADSAVRAEDIDIARVEKAREQAQKDLAEKRSESDFAIAEASLRRASLELQAARKNRSRGHGSPSEPSS